MANLQATDWTAKWGDVWSRKLNGLSHRVSPDPEDLDRHWTREVLGVEDEFVGYEVGLGGAVSRSAR
jgi:hypothetical protein